MSRYPDFYIVGAAKCGTSSMYAYLRQHPDIFMPEFKEPHFFGSDLTSDIYVRDESRYLSLFAPAGPGALRGEASPSYLISTRAAQEIHSHRPDAKILIMIRSPVELIVSLHTHNLVTLNEDRIDLGEALALEPDRRDGRNLPRTNYVAHTVHYRALATLSPMIYRYFDVFPREQIHIVVFDDLKRDVHGEYRRVLRFLGVDDSFVPEFRVSNARRRLRSPRLARIYTNPSVRWQAIARAVRPLVYPVYRGLLDWNTVPGEAPKAVPPELLAELRGEFAEEVGRLSEITGRDLSGWCRT